MSTEKEVKIVEKPPVIEYALHDDGQVTRTDKDGMIHVATMLAGGKLVLVEEWTKFRPAVVRWLNENGNSPTSIVIEGDEAAKPKENIPPMPKKEMRFGDKTPAVVEWYKKYKPAEYKARYGIKGEGTVIKTRTVVNPTNGIPSKEAYEQDCIIADRKIKGTEKAEANEVTMTGEASDYSDK